MGYVTEQQLADAAADCDSLEAVVNGGASPGTVTTRLGAVIKTISRVIQDIYARLTFYNHRGAWATATAYALKDMVVQSGIVYVAMSDHTSGTFATDLAAGKWAIYQGMTAPVSESMVSGFDPMYDGAAGNGTADDTSAVVAANARGKTLFINKPHKLSGTVTLGTVQFGPNGKLIAASGASITITSVVDTRQQIFDDSAGGAFHVAQNWIRPDWFGDVDNSLLKAIDALPIFGGTVFLGIKRYKPNATNYNVNYMAKANISIIGERMPDFSSNCDRLENGSVVEGRFNVFADNFHHENVGYDLGKYVMDTYYPTYDSHSANHPNGETWDAFAFAQPNQGTPLAMRRGFYANNIRGLLRDSASYGHAVLNEGFKGGYLNNIVGMYGIHALVVKASDVFGGFIAGYGASIDNVIFKSDSYAYGGNINFDSVDTGQTPPNTSPWSAPAKSVYAMFFNPATDNMGPVKIGKLRCWGAATLFGVNGDLTKSFDDLQIGQLEINGIGLTGGTIGINVNNCKPFRFRIGTVTIGDVSDGIIYANSTAAFASEPIKIDSLSITNCTLRAIQALEYGRIVIDQFRVTNCATIYSIDDTARVHIGREEIVNPPTVAKFGNSAPTLNAGWTEAIYGSFRVALENYGVRLGGLIQKAGAGSTDIASIPPYLRPAIAVRVPAVAKGTSEYKCLPVSVGSNIVLNEGVSLTGSENWLSLENVSWRLD